MIFKANHEPQMHINRAALPYGLLAGDAFETYEPSPMEPPSPCRGNPKTCQTSWLFSVHEQLHLESASALTPPKLEGKQQYCL